MSITIASRAKEVKRKLIYVANVYSFGKCNKIQDIKSFWTIKMKAFQKHNGHLKDFLLDRH
jgi:hypothetical protein